MVATEGPNKCQTKVLFFVVVNGFLGNDLATIIFPALIAGPMRQRQLTTIRTFRELRGS